MVDNHPIPKGGAQGWGVVIYQIPMATVHQLIYIPPLIGQWLLSIETSLSIATKLIELWQWQKESSNSNKLSTEFADWGG